MEENKQKAPIQGLFSDCRQSPRPVMVLFFFIFSLDRIAVLCYNSIKD